MSINPLLTLHRSLLCCKQRAQGVSIAQGLNKPTVVNITAGQGGMMVYIVQCLFNKDLIIPW